MTVGTKLDTILKPPALKIKDNYQEHPVPGWPQKHQVEDYVLLAGKKQEIFLESVGAKLEIGEDDHKSRRHKKRPWLHLLYQV